MNSRKLRTPHILDYRGERLYIGKRLRHRDSCMSVSTGDTAIQDS
jgi:hypothetical protein